MGKRPYEDGCVDLDWQGQQVTLITRTAFSFKQETICLLGLTKESNPHNNLWRQAVIALTGEEQRL